MRKKSIKNRVSRYKHGHAKRSGKTKTYTCWAEMLRRCNNPNHRVYHNYGGRGIKVCERWNDFVNFLEDMGECPEGMELDRKDNNKEYYKENCRWTTSKINQNNRRNNRLITANGKTQTLAEWSKETNIKEGTIGARIDKLGWSEEKAVTTTVQRKNYAKGL